MEFSQKLEPNMSETWSETRDANTRLVGSGPVWFGLVRVRKNVTLHYRNLLLRKWCNVSSICEWI